VSISKSKAWPLSLAFFCKKNRKIFFLMLYRLEKFCYNEIEERN